MPTMQNAAELIGVWTLVSQEAYAPTGQIYYPRGMSPQGMLMYTADGYMSVQLIRTDIETSRLMVLTTLDTALEGFLAYYGRYTVDFPSKVIYHHVEGCSFPSWRGKTLERTFRLEEQEGQQHLILIAPSPIDQTPRILRWRAVSEP